MSCSLKSEAYRAVGRRLGVPVPSPTLYSGLTPLHPGSPRRYPLSRKFPGRYSAVLYPTELRPRLSLAPPAGLEPATSAY